ncbi:hypothetical protein GTW51_12280 [Aurantimonas aggregata]|uniref:Uncharacterized protein n=1 Tax=Aurantimonas aggregata TaxID=2047720 RepID=A0A6L9MIK7_9HYPH|nr:hypothetical protein [Aurantimonas aggregata]NDV87476.1 hypothetical protein [Aurantimonas aggregata]
MSTVLRFLFVIPFGFIAACLVAAFAMLWPFLELPSGRIGDPVFLFHATVAFGAQSAQIGSVVLLPFALFVLATEIFALSSILLHLAAGLLGGVAVLFGTYGRDVPHMSVQTAILVASLCFALVYWIIAGHRAGRWRSSETRPLPAPTSEG